MNVSESTMGTTTTEPLLEADDDADLRPVLATLRSPPTCTTPEPERCSNFLNHLKAFRASERRIFWPGRWRYPATI